jgi:pilus assembly protein CpaE
LAEKIRMMIVDDIAETRKNLRKLLQLEEDIEVVGEASNGEEALIRAKQLKPDVVLMDINMPVMNGIQATEIMTVELPQVAIIILSIQGEGEYLRKAMAAGAREYLTKPPGREEMIRTIHRVYELEKKRRMNQNRLVNPPALKQQHPGKIFSVFSTKGGVGKSTIAANLAVAIAQLTGKKTVIIDLNLQFGDIAMLFDLIPRRTISDLVGEPEHLDPKILENYLINHSSGVKVLPAPLRPEFAEAVRGKHIEGILKALRENYDYIVIDTNHSFDDITLASLDASDLILMIAALDVLTIKNVKLAMEVMTSLHYETAGIKLILNRFLMETGLSTNDSAAVLSFPVSFSIPYDGKIAIGACNRGIPFVVNDPKAPISEAILGLSRELLGIQVEKKEKISSSDRRKIIGRQLRCH